MGSVVFSESRVSTVGSNSRGEGAKEEQRRWGEYDAKRPDVGLYLEVRGLSRVRETIVFTTLGKPGVPNISVAKPPRSPV